MKLRLYKKGNVWWCERAAGYGYIGRYAYGLTWQMAHKNYVRAHGK